LLTFGDSEAPTLTPENNPWTWYATAMTDEDTMEEGSSSSNVLENVSITARHEELERRQQKLAEYKKIIDTALTLYEREIDNDKFVESFDVLMKPIVKAVGECETALQARKQQGTWGSKKGKLAFWLQ
jgi:hypothetical protein